VIRRLEDPDEGREILDERVQWYVLAGLGFRFGQWPRQLTAIARYREPKASSCRSQSR
jgi:hypothetical protein